MKEIKVAGKRHALDSKEKISMESRPGGWKIIVNSLGKRIKIRTAKNADSFFVHVDGKTIYGQVVAKQREAGAAAAAESLSPQFPGKVRKILVQEGDRVVEGDPLILLEAMKMEFSIKAPSAGTLKKWKIKEGETFSPGAILMDFEGTKK